MSVSTWSLLVRILRRLVGVVVVRLRFTTGMDLAISLDSGKESLRVMGRGCEGAGESAATPAPTCSGVSVVWSWRALTTVSGKSARSSCDRAVGKISGCWPSGWSDVIPTSLEIGPGVGKERVRGEGVQSSSSSSNVIQRPISLVSAKLQGQSC